jgi:hypothetical protein
MALSYYMGGDSQWRKSMKVLLANGFGGVGSGRVELGFEGTVVRRWDSLERALEVFVTSSARGFELRVFATSS